MTLALLAIVCIVLVEFAVRLPFPAILAKMRITAGNAVRVLRAESVSDQWKEKAMLVYAGVMFACSVKLGGLLLLLGVAAVLLIFAFDQISHAFGEFIISWQGIVLTILWASLYLAIRKTFAYNRVQLSRPASTSAHSAGSADRTTKL